jgi:hypothetical protein
LLLLLLLLLLLFSMLLVLAQAVLIASDEALVLIQPLFHLRDLNLSHCCFSNAGIKNLLAYVNTSIEVSHSECFMPVFFSLSFFLHFFALTD